jgi:hypothetical protein
MCGHPPSPASVPPYECDRRSHTGKSGSVASFQRQPWLSISARRHNGGKDPDRCQSVARRTPLIGRRARQQSGFKSDGPNSSRLGQGWVPKFSLSALGHKGTFLLEPKRQLIGFDNLNNFAGHRINSSHRRSTALRAKAPFISPLELGACFCAVSGLLFGSRLASAFFLVKHRRSH